MILEDQDLRDLTRAKRLLEHHGLAVRIMGLLGMPIESGIKRLPVPVVEKINEVTQTALMKAVRAAVLTMDDDAGAQASNRFHRVAAAAAGGIGGFFGLFALAVELPISTTIMLRSIADIARSEGESPSSVESQLACIEVFALGGTTSSDDALDSGYFAIRTALAGSIRKAAAYISGKGLAGEGAPVLVRLISQIANRFSITVSEKTAVQAIPAIGAAGGALINAMFISHFQDLARGHFIVRRLERKYGEAAVKEQYCLIA